MLAACACKACASASKTVEACKTVSAVLGHDALSISLTRRASWRQLEAVLVPSSCDACICDATNIVVHIANTPECKQLFLETCILLRLLWLRDMPVMPLDATLPQLPQLATARAIAIRTGISEMCRALGRGIAGCALLYPLVEDGGLKVLFQADSSDNVVTVLDVLPLPSVRLGPAQRVMFFGNALATGFLESELLLIDACVGSAATATAGPECNRLPADTLADLKTFMTDSSRGECSFACCCALPAWYCAVIATSVSMLGRAPRVLLLGGGACVCVLPLLQEPFCATVLAVEIDTAVAAAAIAMHGGVLPAGLVMVVRDVFAWLSETLADLPFDAVIVDLYSSGHFPIEACLPAFFCRLQSLLRLHGLLCVNMPSRDFKLMESIQASMASLAAVTCMLAEPEGDSMVLLARMP